MGLLDRISDRITDKVNETIDRAVDKVKESAEERAKKMVEGAVSRRRRPTSAQTAATSQPRPSASSAAPGLSDPNQFPPHGRRANHSFYPGLLFEMLLRRGTRRWRTQSGRSEVWMIVPLPVTIFTVTSCCAVVPQSPAGVSLFEDHVQPVIVGERESGVGKVWATASRPELHAVADTVGRNPRCRSDSLAYQT